MRNTQDAKCLAPPLIELHGAHHHDLPARSPNQSGCVQVWGGTMNVDLDVRAGGLHASIFSAACAAREGGDIYYFTVCDDDELTRLAIGDVLGHGAPVSTMSRWMYDALVDRMNALNGDAVLRAMNRLAYDRGIEATTTAAVAAYYRRTSSLYYSYAGHPPLLIRRSQDAGWSELKMARDIREANLPLGILPDTPYDQPAIRFTTGDRMVLYSDGVIEAPDAHDDFFSLPRLIDILNRTNTLSPAQQKREILSELRGHTGDRWTHDDVTLIVVEIC